MPDALVRDETMTGREIDSWTLPGLPDTVTARELIRLRVREEVARLNAAEGGRIDWESEAAAACTSFTRNGFVMLAGEHQVEDLDELIDLRRGDAIAFIRLVPLAGG
jgi:hypothetical protein